ncbi:MAG: alpha-1,2-fucosyltransferase [Acidobacteria bacterium]|nr:alpha-1,2-fucosyltransferase [Acidobacteriota bacterium]
MGNGVVTFSALGRLGRFGNALFEVMSTIGVARKNGFDFQFPLFVNHDHRDSFGSAEDVEIHRHLAHPLPLWTGEVYPRRSVPFGYHDVVLGESTDLWGYLQSEKYFAHCIDEVRHCLAFKDEPRRTAHCAIHWRAGDYQEGDRDVYHPRLQAGYYIKAIRRLPGGTPFLVFSDDREAAAALFAGVRAATGADIEMIGREHDYIESFKIMKNCRHFICANSSYSLAAAILADQPEKTVICPALWFGDVAGITAEDIYPAGALVL